jgi:hypothetical protein
MVSQHNLVNHAFNTILIHLKPHIGIKSNPGDSTGSGLLSSESPADLEFDRVIVVMGQQEWNSHFCILPYQLSIQIDKSDSVC